MSQLRCAAYSRVSSDRQNPLSIDDQIRKCKEFAGHERWRVLEEHIYSDEAISGTTDDRPGLQRLLAALKQRPCPFDVLLVDDTSRLSRNAKDTLTIYEKLTFAGVRLVAISQGIDSQNEQAGVLMQVHGIVDSVYVKELATKTRRGMEGAFLRGNHTGGRCFGYRNVPIEDSTRTDEHGRPVILGVRLEVNEAQAAVVRRIFELYAGGSSLKRITKLLNSEGVASPQPQAGRISRSWCPSSLRVILHNDRYRGLVIWNKTKKVRDTESGRKLARARAQKEWVMQDVPEQRIIADELWNAVQVRQELVKRVYEAAGKRAGLLRSSAMNVPYLFSGLLRCKVCGANLQIVSGRGRNHQSQTYGCPMNFHRGDSVCSNRVRVRRDVLERELLQGLQSKVLREEVIDYVLDQFEKQLVREIDGISGEMDRMKKRKVELQSEIRRLTAGLATGFHSPAVMAEITKREQEISDISDRLLSSKPESVRSRIAALKQNVAKRTHDLRQCLNNDPITARAYLTKHVEKIEMDPEGGIYVASGSWNLLGSDTLGAERTLGMCRGAELNCLRRPFQGRALPVSYPGTGGIQKL
jgi:site-specific DNA recombinase